MPPKPKPEAPGDQPTEGLALTPHEITQALTAAFKCNKNEVAVDYKKYAAVFGLKNGATASASWIRLKKKIESSGIGGNVQDVDIDADGVKAEGDVAVKAEPDDEAAAVESPKKRKRKATSEEDGDSTEQKAGKKPAKNAVVADPEKTQRMIGEAHD